MKKILIVGGGIAGVALAAQLKKHGAPYQITLIERAPEFKNVGYSIALWGNGRRVLSEVGIDQSVIEREGYEVPWEAVETTSHKFLKVFFMNQFKKFGSTVVVPRAVLLKALVEQIDPAIIKLNIKITRIVSNSSEGVEVELTDGTKEQYDLLVAADGVHSWTREHVFRPGLVKPCGYSFYAFWTPGNYDSQGIVTMVGSGKVVFSYPGNDRAVMLLAMKRTPGIKDDPALRKENILKNFKDFGPMVSNIIPSLPPESIMFSDAQYVSMRQWYKDRVLLIGDAQHALSPMTGMGASLALEDACVLAQELARQDNIDGALVAFAERRSKRVSNFQKLSHLLDELAFAKGILPKLRNLFMPWLSPSMILAPIEKFLENKM